jgi:hypothetical protein
MNPLMPKRVCPARKQVALVAQVLHTRGDFDRHPADDIDPAVPACSDR